MRIQNISVFADASFCPQSKAGGGAFWARDDSAKFSNAFSLDGARQAHDAEVMTACEAILQVAAHPELGAALAKGEQTRLVLVIDCLTVQQVLQDGQAVSLAPAATALVQRVWELKRKYGFLLKVNHVKAHSGAKTPRQWVNRWCDQNARDRMRQLRNKKTKA